MKNLIITLALFVLSIAAFGQVDTLRLVEDNSIEVPGEIDTICVQDIADSTKAIFITTANHIYAYDSQSLNLIWTSPELSNPKDLQFGDINNDSYTDVAYKDSLNIYLSDVVNSAVIWTSPELDNTYKCYTIGDRNNDNSTDIIIVSKEPFTRQENYRNMDTVWVNIFDGPSYNLNDQTTILMHNYYYHEGAYDIVTQTQYPEKVFINRCSSSEDLNTSIFINSTIRKSNYGHGGMSGSAISGNYWIIDPIELDIIETDTLGYSQFANIIETNDQVLFFIISYEYKESVRNDMDFIYRTKLFSTSFSSESSQNRTKLLEIEDCSSYPEWMRTHWSGFVANDININSAGYELCYGVEDTLFLLSYPSLEAIWRNNNIYEHEELFGVINSTLLYENTQILYGNCKYLYDGNNGQMTAIFREQDIEANAISDLNTDGNDEILSIDGNTLHIYHLDFATDIDKPMTLPRSTFIQPNFPNPFNATTTIEYGLESEQRVTIEIYDILGRKVHTLVDETKPAGLYQASWNAGETPSGVYFYKINAGDYNKTKKMMLLK